MTQDIRLYGYYRSSTSYRLRIALALKGLAFDYVPVNLLASEQKSEAYKGRNPFGSVPMLEAQGRDRAQSMAQLEWLDEAYPDTPPLLPDDLEDRFTARELAYAVATELHAPLNMPVLKYLKDPLGHSQDEVDTFYRHFLARTLDPLEERLAELDTKDFLFDRPGLFEVVLLPQVYNARRFDFGFADKPHISRIERACLGMTEFQRAHPDAQPDNPENTRD
jgi:maleylacetoacetate isomerase/maleylpyruvate isomerase